MKEQNAIKVFEEKQVRTVWDEKEEKWYFSIIDVIAALTGNERPRKYWNDLKTKLLKEGSQLSEKIGQLKACRVWFDVRRVRQISSSSSMPVKCFLLSVSKGTLWARAVAAIS